MSLIEKIKEEIMLSKILDNHKEICHKKEVQGK